MRGGCHSSSSGGGHEEKKKKGDEESLGDLIRMCGTCLPYLFLTAAVLAAGVGFLTLMILYAIQTDQVHNLQMRLSDANSKCQSGGCASRAVSAELDALLTSNATCHGLAAKLRKELEAIQAELETFKKDKDKDLTKVKIEGGRSICVGADCPGVGPRGHEGSVHIELAEKRKKCVYFYGQAKEVAVEGLQSSSFFKLLMRAGVYRKALPTTTIHRCKYEMTPSST